MVIKMPWKYDGQTFENADEMTDYVRENLDVMDDLDLENYLNDEYRASQMFDIMRDCLRGEGSGYNYNEKVASALSREYYGLMEEAEAKLWEAKSNDTDPVEGQDWEFDGEVFEWVEEEEE